MTIARNLIEAAAVTYDSQNKQVYVSDVGASKIYRMNINGTQPVVLIDGDRARFVRSMALDWIGRKLYYLQSTPEIRVCELNGQSNIMLIDSKYLSQPNFIVVDPLVGYLFYSDWGQPHIGRINMDGTNFYKVISNDISGPLGLTVDLITQRLFWIDRRLQRLE